MGRSGWGDLLDIVDETILVFLTEAESDAEHFATLDVFTTGASHLANRYMAKSLTADGVDWVLDLFFETDDGLFQHELRALAACLPPLDLQARLLPQLSLKAPVRRATFMLLVRARFADQAKLLRPFRADPDPMVRKLVSLPGIGGQ